MAMMSVWWATTAAGAQPAKAPAMTIGLPERLAAPPAEERAGRVALRIAGSSQAAAGGLWPLRGGVPLPMGELAAPDHARVTDAGGKELPAQCSPLARWPDGSIRWLLVETQADPGAAPALFLEYGPMVARRALPKEPVRVETSPDTVSFTTGALRWRVARAPGFRLFDEVSLGGKRLTRPGGRCGPRAGEAEAALSAPGEFRVEEAGPLRATLLARGVHRSPAGRKHLDYVVRATVWAGLPYIQVEHTFVQTDDPIYLEASDIGLDLPLGGASRAVFGAEGGDRGIALNGREAALRQRAGVFDPDGWRFPYAVSQGDETPARGDRAPGWLDVSGPDGGVAVAVKDFWQNAPKALAARPEGLWVGLVDADPVTLHTGMAKTHEMLFVFHAGDWAAARQSALPALRRFQEAPLLVCAPEWYARTGALGEMVPARPGRHAVYEQRARALVERAFGAGREMTGLYGLLDYSDALYGQSSDTFWNNMETAYDHGLFVLSLRTGDKRLLDFALAAARHFGDIDVRHCQPKSYDYGTLTGPDIPPAEAERLTRGLSVQTLPPNPKGLVKLPLDAPPDRQRTFGGFWAGTLPDPAANDLVGTVYGHSYGHNGHNRVNDGIVAMGGSHIGGHTWLLGLIDRYLLLGDRRALEVAESAGQNMVRRPPKSGFRRETGWPAINLVALFHATGNRDYLRTARDLLQYLADEEARRGPQLFANYTYTILQAARDYHTVTGDPGARAFFLHGIESFLAGEKMAADKEGVFRFIRHYGDERVWMTLADLAYAWRLTGDRKYLEAALPNFRVVCAHIPDSVMLWAAPWLLAALEEAGISADERSRHAKALNFSFFDLRFPSDRVFLVNDPDDAPFEIRVLQNTGYRKDPFPFTGSIQVFAPDGSKTAERALDTFGLYTYAIPIPKDGQRGPYRVVIRCDNKTITFSAATDAPGLVAPIPPKGESDHGLYTTATALYLQVPARGAAGVTVTRYLEGQQGGFRLFRPDGALFAERIWPANNDAAPRTVAIPENDKGRGGIWRLDLASEKSWVSVEGIPPYVATDPALLFVPDGDR